MLRPWRGRSGGWGSGRWMRDLCWCLYIRIPGVFWPVGCFVSETLGCGGEGLRREG